MENEELKQQTNLEENNETQADEEEKENTNPEPVEEPYDGPVAVTSVRYDYKTMKYFNMYNMMYKRHFRLVYLIMGFISIALTGYEVYMVFKSASEATEETAITASSFLIPAIFLIFGLYFIYQAIFFEKTVDKNIATHFYRQPKLVHINVTVTERGVSLKIADKESEPFNYDWAYVTEIVEIPQYIFLYVHKQPIIIEKDPNKMIEGDYDELMRMIHDQTQTKPYKLVNKELVTKPITYVHPEDTEGYQEAETVEEQSENTEEVVEEQENNNTEE